MGQWSACRRAVSRDAPRAPRGRPPPARAGPPPATGRRTAAEACGIARAFHEMLLEARLDRGLDLLDLPDRGLDLGPRRSGEPVRSAHRPRRVPTDRTCSTWAYPGGRPRQGSSRAHVDVAAERPASLISSTASTPSVSISSRAPRRGGLGQLDRAHVDLRDRDRGVPSTRRYENVRPSAKIRDVRAATDPSTRPSDRMMPARNSSASTSISPNRRCR